MNCLLIEDSPLKASIIQAYAQENFPAWNFAIEKSYQSGLRRVGDWKPELLILDMTLPNFDVLPGVRAGKPRPLGGYDIMRKLKRKGAEVKVLILTQYESFSAGALTYTYDELRARCELEFPGLFRGMVYFSPSSVDWKKSLSAALEGSGGLR